MALYNGQVYYLTDLSHAVRILGYNATYHGYSYKSINVTPLVFSNTSACRYTHRNATELMIVNFQMACTFYLFTTLHSTQLRPLCKLL